MNLGLSLLTWLLAARMHLAGEVDQPLAIAQTEVSGREFWVLADPLRPTQDWRTIRDREDRIGYQLLIEVGLEAELPELVETVRAVLDDPRGWRAAGREFVPVDAHPQLSIVLASPATVDRLCRPLRTGGVYSCGRYNRATLNADRWREGTQTWAEDVEGYRAYMINHEVGHLLGMPHQRCHEPGAPGAVMVQQTISLDGCAPSGWPADFELDRLRRRWSR